MARQVIGELGPEGGTAGLLLPHKLFGAEEFVSRMADGRNSCVMSCSVASGPVILVHCNVTWQRRCQAIWLIICIKQERHKVGSEGRGQIPH